ncbi:hypothetical protein DFJ68_0736 [Terracoccus luteus]|uniref:EfeO-type cupredoxin-like domain-containing protein n=1 Tax=Terracoccus luteus TaxID=53356 RepID=A0A495XX64_9MICO|nr:hypothetical protein [Terracoccus luteus]RKT77316.1 hypothetical protein DFJ68_0736 [Terracoccus luteus]
MRRHPRPTRAALVPVALAALTVLSACSSSDAGQPAPGAAQPGASSSVAGATGGSGTWQVSGPVSGPVSGQVRRLEVSITGTTVTPAPAQVDLAVGETLELVVTSDHDDELHAHGFEAEAQLKAGAPTTLRLTGAEPGVYEVETHEPALLLLNVAVR